MTSIFPGGNALNAANITKKQQDQSAVLMEKISNGKRLITGADDAGNINKVNTGTIRIAQPWIIKETHSDIANKIEDQNGAASLKDNKIFLSDITKTNDTFN